MRIIHFILSALFLTLLAACGNGIGNTAPTTIENGMATVNLEATATSVATVTLTPEPTKSSTPTAQTPTLTEIAPTEAPEIVWSLNDPEAFPSQSFEYLTSTDFAHKNFLNEFGDIEIFGFPEIGANAVGYENNPKKVPYVLAGVWKTVYQGEMPHLFCKSG